MLPARRKTFHYLVQWSISFLILSCSGSGVGNESGFREIDEANERALNLIKTDRDSAMRISHQMVNQSQLVDYSKGYADAMSVLGIGFKRMQQFDSAIICHREALNVRKRSGNPVAVAKSLSNIGEIYQALEDDKTSLVFFDSAYVIYSNIDSVQYLSGICGNIAISYDYLRKSDSAEYYFRKAVFWAEAAANSPRDLVSAYKNLSLFCQERYPMDSSLNHLKKAKRIAVDSRLYGELPGIILTEGSLVRSSNPEAAEHLLDSALQLANQIDLPLLKERIYWEQINWNDSRNLPTERRILDSLIVAIYKATNQARTKDFAEFEVKYDLAEKEAQNRILKAESDHKSRQQRLLMLLLMGSVILIVFVGRNLLLTRRIAAKDRELAEERIDNLIHHQEVQRIDDMIEAEEKERKRISRELHDRVGSLLGALKLNYNAIEEQHGDVLHASLDAHKAVKSILQESIVEVRKISHNMAGGLIEQFGLSNAIHQLIATLESSGKMSVDFYDTDLNDSLSPHQEITAFRIIQELVGNVLKHAQATSLEISLNRSDDQIIVMVEDDGKGFDVRTKSGGIGMQNMQQRIESIGGKMYIDSHEKSGTSVILEIPVNHEG